MASVTIEIKSTRITVSRSGAHLDECMRHALEVIERLQERHARSDSCVYADKEYSPGSVVDMPDGPKECFNGGWIKK